MKGCEYRLWVREWSQPVIVLLSCRVPETQVYWFPIDHHIGGVVVKAGVTQKRHRVAHNFRSKTTFLSKSSVTLIGNL